MPELELTRTPGDRHLFALGDRGTLQLDGWLSRGATAQAGAASWRLARHGVFQATIDATDPSGTVVGSFTARALRCGGSLRWAGRELELRPSSFWRQRYALADGDRELVTIEGRSWGRRPVKISAEDDAEPIEAGLLLFGAFVVRALAQDAASSSSAAGGASVAIGAG